MLVGLYKGRQSKDLAQHFIKYNQRTTEFGLPWNSGLSKVYRLVSSWCDASKRAAIKPTCFKQQWSPTLGAFARISFTLMPRLHSLCQKRLGFMGCRNRYLRLTAASFSGQSDFFSPPNCSRQHQSFVSITCSEQKHSRAASSKTREESRLSGWQRSWILAPGHTVQSRCLFHCNNQTARAEHLVLPAGPSLAADGQPRCQVVMLQLHQLAILGLTRTHFLQNAPGKSVLHKGQYAFC